MSVNPVGRKDHLVRLGLTIEKFEKILNFKITNTVDRFAASVALNLQKNAKINKQYFVGEAAGFQDCFLGFGMLYAFKSGYLAAKSIIEGLDYNQLLNSEIVKPMKVSATNRILFEKLSNSGYEKLIYLLNNRKPIVKSLLGGNDFRKVMKKLYNNSMSYFLRPLLFW